MPVTDVHPEYAEMLPLWEKCRDTIAGEDRLKAGKRRAKYIPPLAGHVKFPDAYDHYVKSAVLFEAAGRTHQGLVGLVERKDPGIESPSGLQAFVDDATGTGVSVAEFSMQAVSEVLTTGRCGVLTDYPEGSVRGKSKSEVPATRRPYWTLYTAESITNWWHERVDGRVQLVKLTLKETMEQAGADEFSRKIRPRYRVLDLVVAKVENEEGDPVRRLRVRTYIPKGPRSDKEFKLAKTTFPVMNDAPMDEIPFEFINERDTTWNVAPPPLLGLVNLNLGHLRNSAALEHALALIGAPTIYCSQYDKAKEEGEDGTPGGHLDSKGNWIVGGYTVWTFKGDVKPGILSLKKEDVDAIEAAMARKEQQMVVVGARVLAPERTGSPESGEAKKEARFGESSALGTTVSTCSKGLTGALETARDWNGDDGEVGVALNRDFFSKQMSPQDLIALAELWIRHRLFAKTDVRQIARDGELLGAHRDDESIDADLDLEGPPPALGPPPIAGPDAEPTE